MERPMAMPAFMEKLRQAADQNEVEGNYHSNELTESKFTSYWMFTAWSVSIFNVLSMGVVVVHMSTGTLAYAWLPHLAGTAIINSAIGFMAIVYRFVLFPPSLRPTPVAFAGVRTSGRALEDGESAYTQHQGFEPRYNGPYPAPNGGGQYDGGGYPGVRMPPPVPNGTGSPGATAGSSPG